VVYLIIFGTRGVTLSGESGQFNCPDCGGSRAYAHKKVRRFFTLYFIPLIPLDLLGEYIECQTCQSTYKQSVLQHQPGRSDAEEAEFHRAIRRIMVLMMMADGVVEEAERETVMRVYGKIAGTPLTPAELDVELLAAKTDGIGIEATCMRLAGTLNGSGKSMVIKAAFLVAAADGTFQDEERAMLAKIATSMQMPMSAFKQVMAEIQGAAA
jgi:tellurite resistance protein